MGGSHSDLLYDALAELLARPDALDPDSEAAGRIAEIEEKLAQHERQEADELRAAFEGSLRMPLDAGATLAKEMADVLDS